MTRQPKWDKYEVALLIEAYLRVDLYKEPRQKVIRETSSLLRNRAIALGRGIDNVFRNENGINMRLATMQYLFTNGEKGIPNDSKLFAEIYNLYRNDRPAFDNLLKTSHEQVNHGEGLNTLYITQLHAKYMGEGIYKGKVDELVDSSMENNQNFLFDEQWSIKNMDIIEILQEKHIPYTDNRSKGGCLWIYGGHDLKSFIENCERIGIKFHCKPEGSRATDGKPCWWTKAASVNENLHIQTKGLMEILSLDVMKSTEMPEKNLIELDDTITEPNDDFSEFTMWMQARGDVAERTCYAYSSNLRSLLKFCREKNLTTRDFTEYSGEELVTICNQILKNTTFSCYNAKQHNRFSAALKKYVEFKTDRTVISSLKGSADEEEANPQPNTAGISNETVNFEITRDYSGTKPFFLSYFDDEIHFNHSWSGMYVALVKCFYEDYPHFFKKLSSDFVAGRFPAIVVSSVEKYRFVRPVAICDEYVLETNRSATNIVRNIKILLDICNVDYENIVIRIASGYVNSPKATPGRASIRKVCDIRPESYKESIHSDYSQQNISKIDQIVLHADLEGISFKELQDKINMTMSDTKRIVSSARNIVEIKGRLYHEDVFIGWNEGVVQMDVIIDKLMKKNNGYVSSAQLYEYAHAQMHMFLNDNDMDEERAVYDIAEHLYGKNAWNDKHYIFTGKSHISRNTKVRSNFDVFCKYAEEQGGVFRLVELEEYLSSVGIKTGNLRGQLKVYSDPTFFYYDDDTLIYSKSMGIGKEWKEKVKGALNKLFNDVGDHVILRDIQPLWFQQLPELPGNRPWTALLLQSILRYYDQELNARTIIAMDSQSIDTIHSMLVQYNSPLRNFCDVVIAILLENNVADRTFEAETLRQLLVDFHVIQGNELIWNMPKALGGDERFAWDAGGNAVTIRI